jgi:EAL domain-containing protein (putative c-di-GMP-specific phosphodiesterase class I)
MRSPDECRRLSGPTGNERVHLRNDIEDQVARAIEHNEFELDFQPIASITSGQIEAFEALVRWKHPEKGRLMPALFLAPVERSAACRAFTHHVLELAAAQARDWIAAGHTSQVAVNISANLVDHRLATELPELLVSLGVPPRMMVLEITEGAVMDDPIRATRALDQLAAVDLGGIAIDDFGTGQSSLGRLRDLPIDSLKIDRSFVAELDHGVAPAFVRSIIDLGHYLGLRIVAEGIEDEQTWRTLAHLGCDAGQGYWLSPPLPAGELCRWLEEHDAGHLARVGAIGDRRHGPGRRALDRIAGAFDRAPEAMLMSDSAHRWVAINAAARSLLRVHTSAVIDRHVHDLLRDTPAGHLTSVLDALAQREHVTGFCEITIGEGPRMRVRYQLSTSTIPHHHVWALAPIHEC